MLYQLNELKGTRPQAEINGKWVDARPVSGPFWLRVKAAWAVLTGKADAFVWPEGQ